LITIGKKFCEASLQRERMRFLNSYSQEFNIAMAYKIKQNISLISFCKMVFAIGTKKVVKAFMPKVFIAKEKMVEVKPILRVGN